MARGQGDGNDSLNLNLESTPTTSTQGLVARTTHVVQTKLQARLGMRGSVWDSRGAVSPPMSFLDVTDIRELLVRGPLALPCES